MGRGLVIIRARRIVAKANNGCPYALWLLAHREAGGQLTPIRLTVYDRHHIAGLGLYGTVIRVGKAETYARNVDQSPLVLRSRSTHRAAETAVARRLDAGPPPCDAYR